MPQRRNSRSPFAAMDAEREATATRADAERAIARVRDPFLRALLRAKLDPEREARSGSPLPGADE